MPPQDDDVRKSQQSVDNLLDEIPTVRNHRRIYRLANLTRDDEFLANLGLDALGEQELRALLVAAGYETSLEELCDAPFRPKRRLGMATRYSDGSYPVRTPGEWFQPTSFQATRDQRSKVSGLGENYAQPSDW